MAALGMPRRGKVNLGECRQRAVHVGLQVRLVRIAAVRSPVLHGRLTLTHIDLSILD